MNRFFFWAASTIVLGVLTMPMHAQSRSPKGCLDTLVDWTNPWSVTRDRCQKEFDSLWGGRSPLYRTFTDDQGIDSLYFILADARDKGPQPNLFGGELAISYFKVEFKGDALVGITFKIGEYHGRNIPPTRADPSVIARLQGNIGKLTKDPSPKLAGERITLWIAEDYEVEMYEVMLANPGGSPISIGNYEVRILPIGRRTADIRGEAPKIKIPKASLDSLLSFTAMWQLTPGDFEKAYVVKEEKDADQKEPPQFEWVSSAKDRARFSRHMYSNVETKLTMFGGSINVEEAILEFVNGKAARATVSFYNRGDSGDIEVAEFDKLFKTIGQNLGQVMKVAPKRQIMSANAALPVTSWMWSSPSGIALLEYNEYNTPGKVTKPEFLRLKLAAPNQADWSMGKLAVGVQRMELLQRVKKTPEGDVYISGVPMVDQGQKGYCVAASCQRLFEYMRIPCDQHEMANLVSADADTGANIFTMQKSLAKIDGAFKVTFKPLVNPELYYTNNRKRRVSEKEFMSIVKEYTDKGVPLLWGLSLGQKPEEPPLPMGGQVSGGHMRLIIGYNTAKNQLIFTDSWGAGHELKRMAMLDAYDVTMGVYSMAPRGL